MRMAQLILPQIFHFLQMVKYNKKSPLKVCHLSCLLITNISFYFIRNEFSIVHKCPGNFSVHGTESRISLDSPRISRPTNLDPGASPGSHKFRIWLLVPVWDFIMSSGPVWEFRDRDRGFPEILFRMPTPDFHRRRNRLIFTLVVTS